MLYNLQFKGKLSRDPLEVDAWCNTARNSISKVLEREVVFVHACMHSET